MKKIICLLVFSGFIASGSAQLKHYEITGRIEGAEGVKFFLQVNAGGKMTNLDIAIVANGVFKIIGGSVEYPQRANLITTDRKKGLSFYLENSNITISGKLDSLGDAKITGSKTQDEILPISEYLKTRGEKYKIKNTEFQTASKTGDTARMNELKRQLSAMLTEAQEVELKFVKNNPASFAAPEIFRNIVTNMQTTEIESIINAMDPAVAKTPIIVEIKSRVNILKAVDIGKKAPDFTLSDPQGIPVSLSSKIGSKLLLIDFWAAWCGPCRGENPNVVKVWKEFNKKGFDVFGVSLDQKKEDWLKAIADDKLTWTHASDLKYWNSAAAKLYGVNSIPANFLLDKNGIIVGKNLRGEELYNKVKELINTR
jgi:peroxiredoxin